MRLSVLTGLLACVMVFSLSNEQAGASTVNTLKIRDSGVELALLYQDITTEDIIVAETDTEPEAEPEKEAEKPKEIKHKVEKSENLSKIAEKYDTTWRRIFDKNDSIENPDVVSEGQEIIIPNADEQLTPRELPQPVVTTPSEPTDNTSAPVTAKPITTTTRGDSTGNGYVAGYCTWYVKNMRPDLPNNLGNAYSWYSRAASQGMAVGTTPQVGAAGQRGNHVVYVESVNTDGTVTISEMNHKGLYVKTVRTLPANYFRYIY